MKGAIDHQVLLGIFNHSQPGQPSSLFPYFQPYRPSQTYNPFGASNSHYIFDRSDVVSAIGAFTVGLLGNVYSRRMGGTAFTSMVTGVLFLVPSGLSQAGGITANGSGIDIGGAMIAVTIGITVGLFMSQALVYTFGTRKNAAVFSF